MNFHFWNLLDDLPIFDLGDLEDAFMILGQKHLINPLNKLQLGFDHLLVHLLCFFVVELSSADSSHTDQTPSFIFTVAPCIGSRLDSLHLVCAHGIGHRCILSWLGLCDNWLMLHVQTVLPQRLAEEETCDCISLFVDFLSNL